MINVLLVDDHRIFLDGLELVLEGEKEINLIGCVLNGRQAMSVIRANFPDIDVVVLDINMPEMNGIEVAKIVKTEYPEIKIVALTMHNREEYIRQLRKVGIDGYILKEMGKEELVDAIRKVNSGNEYYGNSVMMTIMESLGNDKKLEESRLTKREIEVVKLIGVANSGPEIAKKLSISINTVEAHRRNILTKLGLKNSLELVRYSIQNGLVDKPESNTQ